MKIFIHFICFFLIFIGSYSFAQDSISPTERNIDIAIKYNTMIYQTNYSEIFERSIDEGFPIEEINRFSLSIMVDNDCSPSYAGLIFTNLNVEFSSTNRRKNISVKIGNRIIREPLINFHDNRIFLFEIPRNIIYSLERTNSMSIKIGRNLEENFSLEEQKIKELKDNIEKCKSS